MFNGFGKTEKGDNFTAIYVVDACVFVKWLLPGEPYEKNAATLRQRILAEKADVCAPSFMVQEVANALWDAVRRRRITKEYAQEALNNSEDVQFAFHEFSWAESSEELVIACELDLTVYDAAYLLLSKKMKAQLITADDKMYQKAKDKFEITHLKEYV